MHEADPPFHRSSTQKQQIEHWRKVANKAESTAATLQKRVRDLELKLAHSARDNMDRSAALDAQERVLARRERELQARIQQQTIIQRSMQQREQKLIRERLAFEESQSKKRRDLALREQKMIAVERIPEPGTQPFAKKAFIESPSATSPFLVSHTDPSATFATSKTQQHTSSLGTPSNGSLSGAYRVTPRPVLRRVARRNNLRPSAHSPRAIETPSIAIPANKATANTPTRKLRSDSDLHTILLDPSARSNIPISSARLRPLDRAKASNMQKPCVLAPKTNVAPTPSSAVETSPALPSTSPTSKIPRYQLRSATAKALMNVSFRCL